MSKYREVLAASLLGLLASAGNASPQDTAAGEKVFAKCKACHAVGGDAKHRVGPHLNGLIGRTAGTAEGFKYSPAMMKAGEEGLVWSEETLKPYLADPKKLVKGTKMAFAGLKQDADVANVIAYLASFSEGGAEKKAEADPAIAHPPSPQKQEVATKSMEPAPAEQPIADKPAAQPDEQVSSTSAEQPDVAAADSDGPQASQVVGDGVVLKLGRTATEDEIAAWDIDVRPDGVGLPIGHGTVSQGEQIFDEKCASCHGDFGEAVGRWPVLAGGQGTLKNDRPEKTIGSYWPYLSTVYDYVRRAMPFTNPRSLSSDEVYALTAYVLYLNDVVQDDAFELSNENFTSVHLPNEVNFTEDDRLSEPHYANRREPCMSSCVPGKAQITMHAAVLDVTPEDAGAEDDEAPAAGIE
ncbi:MAG: c-type cytochrome [Mesorhizobium sp.]|nr:MAG: c-type cytochrome [Mesorhizobium sp.]